MFDLETKIRLRPSYFPFTEPSAEMDISRNLVVEKVVLSANIPDGLKF